MTRAEKLVTLYNPDNGTEVEVNEDRAEVLKDRGFTAKRARSYTGPNSQKRQGSDNSAELQAEIDRLKAENEALKNPTDPPQ